MVRSFIFQQLNYDPTSTYRSNRGRIFWIIFFFYVLYSTLLHLLTPGQRWAKGPIDRSSVTDSIFRFYRSIQLVNVKFRFLHRPIVSVHLKFRFFHPPILFLGFKFRFLYRAIVSVRFKFRFFHQPILFLGFKFRFLYRAIVSVTGSPGF
jgi:hypothetical protein